jgi:hypothetical protein
MFLIVDFQLRLFLDGADSGLLDFKRCMDEDHIAAHGSVKAQDNHTSTNGGCVIERVYVQGVVFEMRGITI